MVAIANHPRPATPTDGPYDEPLNVRYELALADELDWRHNRLELHSGVRFVAGFIAAMLLVSVCLAAVMLGGVGE